VYRPRLAALPVAALLLSGAAVVAGGAASAAPSGPLALSPSSGLPGATVTVSASGFLLPADCTIELAGSPTTSCTADENGALSGMVDAPDTPGRYPVVVCRPDCGQPWGGSQTTTLSVEAEPEVGKIFDGSPAPEPAVDLTPAIAMPGQPVVVSGTGFVPANSAFCSVDWDRGLAPSSTCSVDNGDVTASFVVPRTGAAAHRITVTAFLLTAGVSGVRPTHRTGGGRRSGSVSGGTSRPSTGPSGVRPSTSAHRSRGSSSAPPTGGESGAAPGGSGSARLWALLAVLGLAVLVVVAAFQAVRHRASRRPVRATAHPSVRGRPDENATITTTRRSDRGPPLPRLALRAHPDRNSPVETRALP
jgi:hypothetical protein